MLAEKPDLYPAFHNVTREALKPIDYIRVNGGMDEGSGHEDVQFLWTEWHFKHQKLATLCTSQSAGSSYID